MLRCLSLALVAVLCLATATIHAAEPLKAGIIGLDTSHVPAFTKIFNDPAAAGDLAGIKVVVGYPGGTDFEPSRTRVEKFTQGLRESGVEIVDTIPKLLEKVDVVLIESVDGRIHLEEAAQVLKAKKPLFIDKPVAGSLADCIAIYELSKKYGTKCFSSSSTRFSTAIADTKKNEAIGDIKGVTTWGPCSYQPDTPDLFFYGVHGVEALYTLMGTGCQSVSRTQAPSADLVVGLWKDGRIGSYRGIREGKSGFGAVVYGTKGIESVALPAGYKDLCQQIGKFFHSGEAPVDPETTIEIIAYMEAADESKRQGGAPVALADVIKKAQAEASARMAKFDK